MAGKKKSGGKKFTGKTGMPGKTGPNMANPAMNKMMKKMMPQRKGK
jgi:hypothetical protein